ncbi:MAG: hypothetical protein B0A82_09550 [Alkalinema sp. CACIAM 70d]|nr:MAG: hypothetical protein B0A82_09550 [Alkalinema sp. CACIAM 70d]
MKLNVLTLASSLTLSFSLATSGYLATLPNPTDTQLHLAETCNTISIGAATTLFASLDDNEDPDRDE